MVATQKALAATAEIFADLQVCLAKEGRVLLEAAEARTAAVGGEGVRARHQMAKQWRAKLGSLMTLLSPELTPSSKRSL